VFFHSFCQKLAQKVNIFGNFPKCGPETDLGWPPSWSKPLSSNFFARGTLKSPKFLTAHPNSQNGKIDTETLYKMKLLKNLL
jgi:hypothetical protein